MSLLTDKIHSEAKKGLTASRKVIFLQSRTSNPKVAGSSPAGRGFPNPAFLVPDG